MKLFALLFVAIALVVGGPAPCAHAHGVQEASASAEAMPCHDADGGHAMMAGESGAASRDMSPDETPDTHPCPGGDDCSGCAMMTALAPSAGADRALQFARQFERAPLVTPLASPSAFDPPPPRA